MIPYSRQTIDEDDIQAVADALRSDWLTTGPRVDAFEQAFAAQRGGAVCSRGFQRHGGLHLACLAADIGPGRSALPVPSRLPPPPTPHCIAAAAPFSPMSVRIPSI